MKQGLLNYLVVILLAVIVQSCSDNEHSDGQNTNVSVNTLDTLFYNDTTLRVNFFFYIGDKNKDSVTPRNEWIELKVKCDTNSLLKKVMAKTYFFIEPHDSLIKIEKIDDLNFKIRIDKKYKGGYPLNHPDYLSLYPVVQPKKDIYFKGYWMKKAITYPEKTSIGLCYSPIKN